MELVRWSLGGVLIALGLATTIGNNIIFLTTFTKKGSVSSWVPMFGAIGLALGLFVVPREFSALWYIVPFLIDWGSIPGIAHALVVHGLGIRRENTH